MQISELEYQLSALDIHADNTLKEDKNILPKYSEVPDLSIKLMRLQREIEIQSALYLFLSEKYESSKIKEARDTPTIQILDDANFPKKRYKPKRALMVIGYSLIVLVLSCIYVILIEFNNKSVDCTVFLNVVRDDFFNIFFCFRRIPDIVWINNHSRAIGTGIEASCLINSHHSFQS